MAQKHTLILANGFPPSKRLFTRYYSSADFFMCADGGANTAARFRTVPDCIIGDLDSISPSALRYCKSIPLIKQKDQNSTDLEKALHAAIQKKAEKIIVLGATGGQLDHAIGNLSALVKFSRFSSILFVDDSCIIFPIRKSIEYRIPLMTKISLLPLTRCTGIYTSGLKWNLRNESLELGVREGTSNVVLSSPITIKVKKGNLILYAMTNGHIPQ